MDWNFLDKGPAGNDPEDILTVLLKNRGIRTRDQEKEFRNPSTRNYSSRDLHISSVQMEKAIKRIKKARKENESVVVYTDYDADGICSGAILWDVLDKLGIRIMPYVPDRKTEGYGLSRTGIDEMFRRYQPTLLITVDHGITAVKQIAYAKSLGIDTIVFDHHTKPETLPTASAIIHTTDLCASGIAWYAGKEIVSHVAKNTAIPIDSYLDLSAVGTVADLVPLIGMNRAIVAEGLQALRTTRRAGLDALISVSGIDKSRVSARDISHILAPRINAMGRLTHALDALRLLCTRDPVRARTLAGLLSDTNRTRQEMTQESYRIAETLAQEEFRNFGKDLRVLVISQSEFAEGIIGLIAGKLAETYHVPSVVLSRGTQRSKGSARSVRGVNIMDLLASGSSHLESLGGHPMAAGFSIASSRIREYKETVVHYASRTLSRQIREPVLDIDMVLPPERITGKLVSVISELQPFGSGNPEPVFASLGLSVSGVSVVGRDSRHLKLWVSDSSSGVRISTVGFGMAEWAAKLNPGTRVDAAYRITENHFRGKTTLQLILSDVRLSQIHA